MQDMQLAFSALANSQNFQSPRNNPKNKQKIGIPQSYFLEDCVPAVERTFWKSIDALREAGYIIVEDIEIQKTESIYRTRQTIQLSEMYWFYQDLVNSPDNKKLVGKDVMSFFERGSKVGMMELMLASRERLSIISCLSKAFQEVDFLAMPTCLTTAPKIDDILGRETVNIWWLLVRNSELFNLSGLPSLSIPTHRLDSSELPTAIEISGRALEDERLLQVGESIWKIIHASKSS